MTSATTSPASTDPLHRIHRPPSVFILQMIQAVFLRNCSAPPSPKSPPPRSLPLPLARRQHHRPSQPAHLELRLASRQPSLPTALQRRLLPPASNQPHIRTSVIQIRLRRSVDCLLFPSLLPSHFKNLFDWLYSGCISYAKLCGIATTSTKFLLICNITLERCTQRRKPPKRVIKPFREVRALPRQ